MDQIVGIIPARYASQRLPGKALAKLAGKPMIQHVYERAMQAPSLARVLVATDDARIRDTVLEFGGEAIMTDAAHATGTDRLAEVAEGLEDVSIVVNIQGDEPLLSPDAIEAVIAALLLDPSVPMSSAMGPLPNAQEANDPNVVKVVTDLQGFALYFSRSPIPLSRADSSVPAPWKKHIGLYAYRREFLLYLSHLEPSELERCEGLEQLRALEHGHRIQMALLESDTSIGVDTPEDLARVRRVLEQAGSAS
jgi:3-deoxy-manno-octulosonate cytidylyltransferase (CMP-KDO synthetase)